MKLHVQANGFDMTGDLERYAEGKLAHLHKLLPRQQRTAASCDLTFTRSERRAVTISTCKLTLRLGGQSFQAEESTQHMYAALDIATVHIERQLLDYLVRQGLRHPKGQWQIP